MLAFLRELGSLKTEAGHKVVKNAKVLLVADDIGQRAFPFWASRNIDQTGPPYYVDEAMYQSDKIART
ncbi:hypothetical protein HDU96_004515, partial [Phlyctochytrium bullatum]